VPAKVLHPLLIERRIDPRWVASARDYTPAWVEITCTACGAEYGCPVSSRKGRLAAERQAAVAHANAHETR
jgi:hypothetical protein